MEASWDQDAAYPNLLPIDVLACTLSDESGNAGSQSNEAARQPQPRVRRPYSEFSQDPAVLKALRTADDAAASRAGDATREQLHTPAVSSPLPRMVHHPEGACHSDLMSALVQRTACSNFLFEVSAENKKRLHLVVMGHVDAGKSTLMGRLLADLGVVTQKQARSALGIKHGGYAFTITCHLCRGHGCRKPLVVTRRLSPQFEPRAEDGLMHDRSISNRRRQHEQARGHSRGLGSLMRGKHLVLPHCLPLCGLLLTA